MCIAYEIVGQLLHVYFYVLLAYAVVSWIPSLQGNWTRYLAMLVDPVLVPLRRVIPPIGGLDLSFLVLMLAINLVNSQIVGPQTFAACVLR